MSQAFISPSSTINQRWMSSETSLQMGIRSFVQNRFINRRGDDNNEEDKLDISFLVAPTPAPAEEEAVADDTEDETQDQPSNSDRTETPQERMQRVKSGGMTDEEKKAFVNAALMSGRKPPLRQPIPPADEARRRPTNPVSKTRETLFGRKSINMNQINAQALIAKEKTDEQKQKQKYFDMVTNPNRFKVYTPTDATSALEADIDDVVENVMPPDIVDNPNSTAVAAEIETEELDPVEIPLNTPTDLGKRLEAAAVVNEERLKIERSKKEQQRLEEDRRLAEFTAKREQELRDREAATLARKKEQLEAAARAEEEQRTLEAARKKALIAAQDDYWRKKLGKSSPAPASRAPSAPIVDQSLEDNVVDTDNLPTENRAEEERQAGFLRLNDVKRAKEAIIPGSKTKARSPALTAELARKQAEIDKAREEQLARIRSLNTPLPLRRPPGLSPPVVPSPYAKSSSPPSVAPSPRNASPLPAPVIPRPVPRPAAVATPVRPPAVAGPATPVLGIKDILRKKAADAAAAGTTVTPKAQEAPRVNMMELMRKKALDDAAKNNASVSTAAPSPVVPPPTIKPQVMARPVAAPSPFKSGTNLGALGRLLGGGSRAPASISADQNRPVRQELPEVGDQADGQEDDFETFSRNSPNTQMSIGAALKTQKPLDKSEQDAQAKKWGIDLTKYK